MRIIVPSISSRPAAEYKAGHSFETRSNRLEQPDANHFAIGCRGGAGGGSSNRPSRRADASSAPILMTMALACRVTSRSPRRLAAAALSSWTPSPWFRIAGKSSPLALSAPRPGGTSSIYRIASPIVFR